ncbi:MAG: hypothetical protein AAF664_09325 [Planctomycetota bacterium]
MRKKNKKTSSNAHPFHRWHYRWISAFCGLFLGLFAGVVFVVATDTSSILFAVLMIGATTTLATFTAYRIPHAPDVLRILADFLK